MAEEKPRKSLSSSSRESMKNKNPFSRVKDDNSLKSINTMRKSWSTDSLSLLSSAGGLGKSTCVCAPTKHQGSFRCRLHRAGAGSHAGSFDASPAADGQLHLPKTFLSSLAETKES